MKTYLSVNGVKASLELWAEPGQMETVQMEKKKI